MKKYKKPQLAVAIFCLLSGCTTGTRSNLRPADLLKKGQLETTAALTGPSGSIPSYPMIRIDYGLFDKIEMNGKLEYGATLMGGRWGLFSSDSDDFALAVGLHIGTTTDLTQQHEIFSYYYQEKSVWIPSVNVGKKMSFFEPYFSYQAFMTYKARYQTGVYKVGSRLDLKEIFAIYSRMFLTAEIGYAQHQMTDHRFLYLPEGSLGLSYPF